MARHAPGLMVAGPRATLRPFTPSREAPEALVQRTVGRHDLLASLHKRLRAAATSKTRSHTLLVGPRGSGKTHVIDVALQRLRTDERLASRLAVARVDEDAVGIVTYADLLLRLVHAVAPEVAASQRSWPRRDVAAIEADIVEALDGRVLVAVIENLAKVFDSLGAPGQRDLRSFVETTGQVVLLASTPLLFRAIGSRDEPWFGSFAIEHLPELTLDEGVELIRRLAEQDGDDAFVRFLDSPKGRARLAALHHLAGGSPRLWMILAGCATVELLDDLVPAVEELLESLVAYYQQRLWELPGNEQKLVWQLGTGPPSASVADLAAACELDERTAATALGRLADTGWVRREKLPGTDQRKSWYRLREPLLRHHFQYRQTDGEPLRLIVEILRVWFDPEERYGQLSAVRPASVAERHVLAALRLDPPRRADTPYADRNLDLLLAEARRWINEPGTIGTLDAGILVEALVIALRSSPAEGRRALDARHASTPVRRRTEALIDSLRSQPADESIEDMVGTLLDAAAAASRDRADYRVLELVACCWNGARDPVVAVERLHALSDPGATDRLGLTIRDEHGFWLGQAGRHDSAVAVLSAVLQDRSRVLGPDHPDTLVTRHTLAFQLGQLGRHDEALAALSTLAEDRTRVLGPDHPDTLATRHDVAFQVGELGRHDEALTAFTALLEDRSRVLGPDHPGTLVTRHNVAIQLVGLGRYDEALAAFSTLLEDTTRVQGPDHPDTLLTRHHLAIQLVALGRHDEALAAFGTLLEDTTRVQGPDHPDTLLTRHHLAIQLVALGRHDEALAAFSALAEDRTRVLGPDHPDTLATRHNLAFQLGELGRHDDPIELAVRVLDDVSARDVAASRLNDELAWLFRLLLDQIRAGRFLPPADRLGSFAASRAYMVLNDMEAARDGSAEAAARLPAELRELVSPSP